MLCNSVAMAVKASKQKSRKSGAGKKQANEQNEMTVERSAGSKAVLLLSMSLLMQKLTFSDQCLLSLCVCLFISSVCPLATLCWQSHYLSAGAKWATKLFSVRKWDETTKSSILGLGVTEELQQKKRQTRSHATKDGLCILFHCATIISDQKDWHSGYFFLQFIWNNLKVFLHFHLTYVLSVSHPSAVAVWCAGHLKQK